MYLLPLLGWLFTALLLVLVIVSTVAARGGIRLNHLVGIRLPALMQDEQAWERGHRAACVPALVAFGVALVCSLVGLAVSAAYAGSIAAFVGGVIWVMIRASRVAARV